MGVCDRFRSGYLRYRSNIIGKLQWNDWSVALRRFWPVQAAIWGSDYDSLSRSLSGGGFACRDHRGNGNVAEVLKARINSFFVSRREEEFRRSNSRCSLPFTAILSSRRENATRDLGHSASRFFFIAAFFPLFDSYPHVWKHYRVSGCWYARGERGIFFFFLSSFDGGGGN